MNGIYVLAALVLLASITPDALVKPSAWLERIRTWFGKLSADPADGKVNADATPANKPAGVTIPAALDAKGALVQLQIFFATASPASRVKAFEACDVLNDAIAAELSITAPKPTPMTLTP